jgi:hypothetical protein
MYQDKESLFNKWCRKNWNSICIRKKLYSSLSLHKIKTDFKWIKDKYNSYNFGTTT